MIYTDYIGRYITDASYGGVHNLYSATLPNNGIYCLNWKGFSQYNTTAFDFKPDRDFSRLVSEGYALDFMVRGNAGGIKFDVRFMDTKESETDHPWRIRFVIDETVAAFDKKWHHVNIRLDAFTEHGSWDGQWYNPQGLFDWKKIDRFEYSTEYTGTTGKELWFDNIHITNRDTAMVRENGTVGIKKIDSSEHCSLTLMPNPFSTETVIRYGSDTFEAVSLRIISMTGQVVRDLFHGQGIGLIDEIVWEGRGDNGATLPAGVYLCILTTPSETLIRKVVKVN